MAQGIHRIHGVEKMQPPIVAANDEVFADNSPVTVNSSGFLAVVSSSGEKLYGYVKKAFTAIAANQTGTAGTYQTSDPTAARYAPPVLAPENVDFWADADIDLVDTDLGAYADVASESNGVVTINLLATTSGQFAVLGLLSAADPNFVADTTKVIVRAAELTTDGYTQD